MLSYSNILQPHIKGKIMFTYFLSVLIFWTGCNILVSNSETEFSAISESDTVNVAFGETTYVEEEFIFHFEDLLDDSRCPMNVLCEWEGNAKVKIKMRNNFQYHTLILNTYGRYRQDTTIGNYNIKLEKVLPYPVDGEDTEIEDYSVILIIDNKSE